MLNTMLFLINLDSAFKRRNHMTSQLIRLGLRFERIGIDLRASSVEEVAALVRATFPAVEFDLGKLSGAEVGCWLSHLSCWKRMRERNAGACTVLEDDLLLDDGLAAAVSTLATQDAFDVVYLGTSSRNLSTRRRTAIGPLWAHQPVGAIYNTWGYSMSRAYIDRFFGEKQIDLDIPIDHFLGGLAPPLSPRIAVVRPNLVSEHSVLGAASQIEPFTHRVDRWRIVGVVRRRLLSSRISHLYDAVYRML